MTSSARRPTLADVARESGASLKTVSRVINGVSTVAPDLAERVTEAAERLGYRPNRMAANLRSGRSDMIGFIIRDMSNPFYAALAAGAASIAEAHGSLLFTASSEGQLGREQKLLEEMLDRRVDGVLITPARGVNPAIAIEMERRTPIVAVDVAPEGVDVDVLSFDNYDATYRAVSEAVRAGYRRFALVLDSYELRTMELRAAGARAALADAGLRPDPDLIRAGHHTSEEARVVAANLLDRADPPDAIFCANNIAAIGVASEVGSRHAATALVSFDDFPLSSTLSTRLFVVKHDTREMGARAATLLFERVHRPDMPARHVLMPTSVYDHNPDLANLPNITRKPW